MNYEFTASLLAFTIVMIMFNLFKDFYILKYHKISGEFNKRLNRRWLGSYAVGVVLIYLMYG